MKLTTIEQWRDWCKTEKLNPAELFVDSKGRVMMSFHTHKQQMRAMKAMEKYDKKHGLTDHQYDYDHTAPVSEGEYELMQEYTASKQAKH